MNSSAANSNNLSRRFGIGEWYGKSFVRLTSEERKTLAEIALGCGTNTVPSCPFKDLKSNEPCTKKGGVCSLRLYEDAGDGSAVAVTGDDGDLRTVCPHRFKQKNTIYKTVGEYILGAIDPRIVSEVRFLQRYRVASSEDAGREDVGNIDNVLVHPTETNPMRWCALEIQAVYFSGKAMSALFRHIQQFTQDAIPFPDAVRRPDYRSSGPKRLMPQLQIKVPTLRRWGKKMAVVVDAAFYRSLGEMNTVKELSNCDIAWFVVRYEETEDGVDLLVGEPEKQTLERAVEGLTGGFPVALAEFEAKISEKLAAQ